MIALIQFLLLIFWVLDITNMPFMEMFDTTYPMNTLFWMLIWIFVLGFEVKIKKNDGGLSMSRLTEYHGGIADEETKMDKITTEFAEHICDNLCRYPNMADGKSLEIICSECKIAKFICDILNEHNRINDLDKTQSAKLLKQVQELKERDTAKRLNEICGAFGEKYECPNCGSSLRDIDALAGYCKWCGQRVEV